MENEAERQKFEQWAESHLWDTSRSPVNGRYLCRSVQDTWEGWLKRASESSPPTRPNTVLGYDGRTYALCTSGGAAATAPSAPPTEIRGTWPEHCIQRAFVEGAEWWQFHANGATMFASERDEAEAEAIKKYGAPSAPTATDWMRPKIYAASRASVPERPVMWRSLREHGVPIISSWIDEAEPGATANLSELWTRIVREIASADCLVLYVEAGDFPLKGALIEVGIALGMGKPVRVVAPGMGFDAPSYRPIGSWIMHPLVEQFKDLRQACIAKYAGEHAGADKEKP